MDQLNLFNDFTPKNISHLCHAFQVHKGTAKRWIKTGHIPKAYTNKDQFYTSNKMALKCFDIFKKQTASLGINLKDYSFLEPSAGKGVFYDLFPKGKREGFDLYPKNKKIKKMDYLKWKPRNKRKYVILGNPPFGLRGNMALRFINHSIDFADVIGFILPQLFESDGKGSPMKRVTGYKLAYSQKLKDNVFYNEKNNVVKVNVIFQIWTKINTDKIKQKTKTCNSFIKIYSLSNGGTPCSTRNKKMLNKCDIYLPSTCYSGMRAYSSFKELPNKRGYGVIVLKNKKTIMSIFKNQDWQKISFKSTNSAFNLRTSLIQNVLIKKGFFEAFGSPKSRRD